MDLEIRKFQASLVAHINHNKLPMEIKRLVLAEVYKKVSDMADDVIDEQRQAETEKKEMKKQEKEVTQNAEST